MSRDPLLPHPDHGTGDAPDSSAAIAARALLVAGRDMDRRQARRLLPRLRRLARLLQILETEPRLFVISTMGVSDEHIEETRLYVGPDLPDMGSRKHASDPMLTILRPRGDMKPTIMIGCGITVSADHQNWYGLQSQEPLSSTILTLGIALDRIGTGETAIAPDDYETFESHVEETVFAGLPRIMDDHLAIASPWSSRALVHHDYNSLGKDPVCQRHWAVHHDVPFMRVNREGNTLSCGTNSRLRRSAGASTMEQLRRHAIDHKLRIAAQERGLLPSPQGENP